MSGAPLTGLVMTGGGARGAYQAGAMLAVCEIAAELGIATPFPVLAGASAGAINTAYLATRADDQLGAARDLCRLWGSLTADQVFRTGPLAISGTGARWFAELSLGGLWRPGAGISLLDTAPLRELLARELRLDRLPGLVERGVLHGLAITLVDYCCGASRTHYQGHSSIRPWNKDRRIGEPVAIEVEHVLASAAIPILFPPVRLGAHFFGDGSLRNYTPISGVTHLGASRVLVVGVRRASPVPVQETSSNPSVARVVSSLLNSVLLDAVDLDVERAERINRILALLKAVPGATAEEEVAGFRPLRVLLLRPSRNLGRIAAEEYRRLPPSIRYAVRGLGSPEEAADLISYLHFEPAYTRRLLDLGYSDTRARGEEVKAFLGP